LQKLSPWEGIPLTGGASYRKDPLDFKGNRYSMRGEEATYVGKNAEEKERRGCLGVKGKGGAPKALKKKRVKGGGRQRASMGKPYFLLKSPGGWGYKRKVSPSDKNKKNGLREEVCGKKKTSN